MNVNNYMNTYYCRNCATSMGDIKYSLLQSVNLTGDSSGYQLDKFLTHSQLGYAPRTGVSVFNSPKYDDYRDLVIGAYNSGCLEVDFRNRKNITYWAGSGIGNYQVSGSPTPLYVESGVRVVLFDDLEKIHGFTCNPTGMLGACCAGCGGSL